MDSYNHNKQGNPAMWAQRGPEVEAPVLPAFNIDETPLRDRLLDAIYLYVKFRGESEVGRCSWIHADAAGDKVICELANLAVSVTREKRFK
jgi:hypothetical protein